MLKCLVAMSCVMVMQPMIGISVLVRPKVKAHAGLTPRNAITVACIPRTQQNTRKPEKNDSGEHKALTCSRTGGGNPSGP